MARARCLIELERPLEAWDALEPLLARDPGHLVAAKLAVEVFLRLGDRDRARASLARYASLGTADPDLVRLQARVGELESGVVAAKVSATGTPAAAGTPDADAVADVDRAGESTSAGADDEVVTVTLGNLYLQQGHRAEAERIFRRILSADPDHAAARQALARALGARPRTGE